MPVRTIEIDGQNDFREEDRLPTGDGKQLYATWDETHLFVGFANEDLSPDNKALYLALDVDGEPLGSRITPRGEWFEGSTVFLPIAADVLIFAKSYQGKAEVYRRVWQDAGWAARAEEPKVTCRFTAGFGECAIDRSLLNGARTLNFAAWAKDLASAAAPGWGWTFGTSDAELPGGAGERVLRHFHAFDLTKPRAESVPRVRRTGREGARIYQLLVRLFGNRNATRKVNGTLAENGVGRFADLDDKALAALKELSVSHVWLTGVLQQATATDYAAAGQGADDPDLLKGLAGSPYAIRDYFDVSPDYATDPAKRLEEFDALLARLHGRGLKALIDLVPNHVARSYASDVKPEHDFGTRGRGGQGDDASKFFDPGNNFFHLQQPLTLPFAQSSTCQLGTPPLREPCDGRFAPENGRARVTGNNVTSERPSVGDWYETVKLNFGFDFTNGQRSHPRDDATDAPVPDTWTKLDAVIAYWQARGVDGFRVDMAHMVPHQFWQWAIARARQRDADVLFIAEAYETNPASTVGNVLQHLLH
ncbi:MAG: alpha-amylase family glycosyl hydrolase, partial [Myxococcales bacterium]